MPKDMSGQNIDIANIGSEVDRVSLAIDFDNVLETKSGILFHQYTDQYSTRKLCGACWVI